MSDAQIKRVSVETDWDWLLVAVKRSIDKLPKSAFTLSDALALEGLATRIRLKLSGGSNGSKEKE